MWFTIVITVKVIVHVVVVLLVVVVSRWSSKSKSFWLREIICLCESRIVKIIVIFMA